MRFQNQDVIELERERASLLVAPQSGGRLLRWRVGGHDVIGWPDNANWNEPARVRGGNPLLFPFLGRHRVDGTIGRWRDHAGVVRALPMHGFARDLPFEPTIDVANARIDMTLTDSDATRTGYPFGFRFDAIYHLIDGYTLDATLTTTNTGDTPLPYYAGHHFYFSLPHGLRSESLLSLPPARLLYQRDDGVIAEAAAAAREYRLDDARIVDRFHALDPLSGGARVTLHTPSLGRTITLALERPGSIPWYAVTTWTEKPDSDFYCIEPWLGLPDAIHNGLGLRWLAPGASERAVLRIRVELDE
ncbi:aldose epimerase [Mycetohabitans rhizoxinica]|uniref:aldose epimerase family protein n=1 Tax=Mycetohabitans TaxID=2571159 RepID=UPI001F33D730|nr:aldose epimerase [Mycetohabitans sp. B2]MCF7696168.1 aldose epimerase [Mycetohabitans sp. B2]